LRKAPTGDVDALAELTPFSKALASVATREEPEKSGAPDELVAAAYVVRAAWLALHRGDDEIHEMAMRARRYLDGTEMHGIETLVCKMFTLPPIKGGNRAERMRDLLAFAEMALKGRRDADGDPVRLSSSVTLEIAGWMNFAIEKTFPQILPDAPLASRFFAHGDASEMIARAIGDDFKTARDLVTRTLRALGVSELEVKSWLKSAEQRP
jgi:hypothetical protein